MTHKKDGLIRRHRYSVALIFSAKKTKNKNPPVYGGRFADTFFSGDSEENVNKKPA